MRRIYITFGGAAYDKTTQRIVEDAPKFGVDEVWVYDDRWLIEKHPEFYTRNHWLWETDTNPAFGKKFGFGWCCWKAFTIIQALRRCAPGDLLLYTDADTYPISDLSPIFDLCAKERIVLFEAQGCPHHTWTRRDCMVAMGSDKSEYYDKPQACGRFSMWTAGDPLVDQFLAEWMTYSVNLECQRLDRSHLVEEFKTFRRHSNEQSVLGLLSLKYGIVPHREACQFGWPIDYGHFERRGLKADEYPQLFHQQWADGDRSNLSGSRYRNV